MVETCVADFSFFLIVWCRYMWPVNVLLWFFLVIAWSTSPARKQYNARWFLLSKTKHRSMEVKCHLYNTKVYLTYPFEDELILVNRLIEMKNILLYSHYFYARRSNTWMWSEDHHYTSINASAFTFLFEWKKYGNQIYVQSHHQTET